MRAKLKGTQLIIIFLDYTMSFKKSFNSKHRAKLKMKAKDRKTLKAKTQEHKNLVLSNEQVENADLYKPVLNKIMITRE